MGDWIEAGQKAPDFALKTDDGATVRLKELRGRMVVVYFYPRDDTPGCTREACAFRDRKAELVKLGVDVLGVSTDDAASHRKFRAKYDLNFPLLVDADHKTAEAFGAWREKNMYGKKSMGIARSTFLIDGEGVVRRTWPKVNVDGHDEEVIAAVKELSGAAPAAPAKAAAKPKLATKPKAAAKPAVKKKAAVAAKAPRAAKKAKK